MPGLLIQTLYWLALSTWFGGVLFIAVAAPVIFRTVREGNPVLPTVLSVNMEGQHGTLLAGTIVANLLALFTRIGMFCAIVLAVVLGGQWLFAPPASNTAAVFMTLKSAFFLAAVGLVVFDAYFIAPKIQKHRQTYLDHADEPEIANPAKDAFDRHHRESVTVLSVVLMFLLGMIVFGGTLTQTVLQLPE